MNRLASCVFLLIGTTFSDTILTKAYEDIHEVKCRNYKDILPNGACMKYLSKYKIYQSISRSKSENKDLEQLVIFRFVVKNPTKPYFRRLLGLYYEYASLSPCSNVQAFNRLFDAFGVYVKTLITKHWDCVEIIIQLLCFVRHPTCLQSVIDNKTIISPPCLRNCKNNKCFILMLEILEKLQSFHEICPRKASDQSFYINMTQCFPLPHEDMNNIERCQLLRFTQGKRNFTTNCFQDNGGSYNGSVNVTITGKTCMPWSINPFLSSPVYSDLQSNFCRNPQGYARAPWCYVNETSRHWEYCNIPECVLEQPSKKLNLKYQVFLYILVPAFIFVILPFLWQRFYHRIHNNEDVGEQCPYSTCDIEHPGKTTELIVQFQESYL